MSHSCPMCPTSVVRQAKSSPLILEHAIWLCLITGLLKQQWYTISFPKDWGKTLRGCWLAGRHKKKLKNKHKYLFKLIEIYISANSLLQDKKTTVTWLASDLLGQELCSGTVVCQSTTLVETRRSRQPLDGLPWNLHIQGLQRMNSNDYGDP